MDQLVIEIGRQALLTVLLVAGPVLGFSLLVGVLISLLQATTQINEQTLAFVPKIVAVLGVALVFGPWMMTTLIAFATELLSRIPDMIR